MSLKNRNSRRSVLLLGVALALLLAVAGYTAGRSSAAPTVTPPVLSTVIQPACPTSVTAGSGYTKIADMGTFEVQAAESLIEVTFHGRVYASSTNGTGVQFELRVDDSPSPAGRIRAVLRTGEISGGSGSSVSMGGFFEGLAPGTHTVSMWARTGGGGSFANNAMYDPGCWSNDHVLVKEYLPFGTIAVPVVVGQ